MYPKVLIYILYLFERIMFIKLMVCYMWDLVLVLQLLLIRNTCTTWTKLCDRLSFYNTNIDLGEVEALWWMFYICKVLHLSRHQFNERLDNHITCTISKSYDAILETWNYVTQLKITQNLNGMKCSYLLYKIVFLTNISSCSNLLCENICTLFYSIKVNQ